MRRKLFRSTRYIEQIEAIPEGFSRTQERITRLEESLQDNCEGYPGVIGMPMQYIRIVGFSEVAPLIIYFNYDDQNVVMLRAELQIDLE